MYTKLFSLLMMGITSFNIGLMIAILGKIALDGYREIKRISSKP